MRGWLRRSSRPSHALACLIQPGGLRCLDGRPGWFRTAGALEVWASRGEEYPAICRVDDLGTRADHNHFHVVTARGMPCAASPSPAVSSVSREPGRAASCSAPRWWWAGLSASSPFWASGCCRSGSSSFRSISRSSGAIGDASRCGGVGASGLRRATRHLARPGRADRFGRRGCDPWPGELHSGTPVRVAAEGLSALVDASFATWQAGWVTLIEPIPLKDRPFAPRGKPESPRNSRGR